MERPKVVAFDVIETLFSLDAVKAEFDAAGLVSPALNLWFATGLRDAFALAASEAYAPFRDVLAAALDEVSAILGQPLDEAQKEKILDAVSAMTPHADVEPALAQLGRAGIRVIALSNGSTAIATRLIEGAGLEATFERILSADGVGRSKPHPDVYRHAADSAGVKPGETMLIAAHPWDVHGAKSAGLLAGYVDRGRPYPSFMQVPDFAEHSLDRLVELVLVS
jgi:2-haloacid dehalogenase